MSRAAIGFRSMCRSRDGESLIMLLDKVGRVSHDAGGPAHPGDLNILCLETQANAGGEQAGRWRAHWPEVRGGVVARPRRHLLETIVYPPVPLLPLMSTETDRRDAEFIWLH